MKCNKILCMILALALVVSLAACGAKPTEPETDPTDDSTQTTPGSDTQQSVTADSAVTYFSMTMGKTFEDIVYLTAYSVDGESAQVEYTGSEKKVGTCDSEVLLTVANAFANTKLADLNGKDAYKEGDASGSMYVEYADGTSLSVNFSGVIPQEFSDGFAAMEACFKTLTADMPLYVPEPVISGEVDATRLAELQAILNGSGITNLDSFMISEVPLGGDFTFAMGLQSADGILGGSTVGGMMMTDAYSIALVTLEKEADIQKVRDDFQNSLDWQKWVCVMPTHALIAQKGNMVLCLMGAGDQYAFTKSGIEATGWENLLEIKAEI